MMDPSSPNASPIITPNLAKSERLHWLSAIQFGLSALAIFSLWSAAVSALLVGLIQIIGGGIQSVETLQLFMLGISMGFCGVLILPSATYSLARLVGRPLQSYPANLNRLRPTLLIFAFPLLAGLGYWISQNSELAWLFLPPVHVLAIGLPVLWLTYIGVRDLPLGSPQRTSGVFTSGLTLAPFLILVVEAAAVLAGILVFSLVMAFNPELADTINRLAEQLRAAPPSAEAILRTLQPIVNNRFFIFAVIVFGAVIIPLIEEQIKPIGVWLLAGRQLTPAEGYALGALSGAGYALVESLFLTSSGQDWTIIILARIGTSAVHILTAGLMGWALATAWGEGRYLRLGAVYLLAVLIHGLWNGLTITNVFANLSQAHAANPGVISQIGQVAPYALAGLAGASFLTILLINRGFRHKTDKASGNL